MRNEFYEPDNGSNKTLSQVKLLKLSSPLTIQANTIIWSQPHSVALERFLIGPDKDLDAVKAVLFRAADHRYPPEDNLLVYQVNLQPRHSFALSHFPYTDKPK